MSELKIRLHSITSTARVFALAFLLSGAGCEPAATSYRMGEAEFAGMSGSGEPNLYAAPDGRILLTWLEPAAGESYALRVAVREDGAWSEPRTIRESEHFFVNWADFPSLIQLPDGAWVVHWLEKVAESTYAYHVRLAISRDAGASWSEPITPHRDRSPTEHGFVSMLPWDGGAALVWLDGRQMKTAEEAGEAEDLDMGDMSVRATTIEVDGALGADLLIDDRSCECCQTSLARTSAGLVAAYRDRSREEVRDIAVSRYADGGWTRPTIVAEDNWVFPGCPVNGPRLSARADDVVIAWFTGADRVSAVYTAFSSDGGESFGPPIRTDEGDPLGRVDALLLSEGSALLVWLERTERAAEVLARRVEADGTLGAAWRVAEISESRGSGFPRVVAAGDELLFAWTVTGEEGGVRVAAALPAGR